jgi:hypothetical protein
MASSWEAQSAHPESRNLQQNPSSKSKKQPKTQTATAESRNLSVAKVAT